MNNPVGSALTNLSGTIERAGQRSGQSQIDMANLDLAKAKMDYEMNDPVRQLERTEAAQKIQQSSMPVTPSFLTGGNQNGFETGNALVNRNNPDVTVFDLIAKEYGYNNFQDGQWVDEEGKVFTRGDYETNPDIGNSIFLAHTNLFKIARGNVEMADTIIPTLDPEANADQIQQLDQARKEAQEFLTNPRKQVMGLMEQAISLNNAGDRFKGALSGIDRKIKLLQQQIEFQEKVPAQWEAYVQGHPEMSIDQLIKKFTALKKAPKELTRAEKKDVGKEKFADLNASLFKSELIDFEDGEYTFKKSYTPEEYKIIEAEANARGYEPVSREGRSPEFFTREKNEPRQYTIAGFKKMRGVGKPQVSQRKASETIDQYLKRMGK